MGLKYGLPLLSPVDDAGVFTEEAGQFQGLQVPRFAIINSRKRKHYAFWRQFNEKPNIIPGCPGPVSHLHELMCLSLVFNDDAASAALHICCRQAAGHCHHLLLTSRS